MRNFIVVHVKGKERIVNLAWVEEIWEDFGHAVIYFAFQGEGYTEQDHICTDETYSAVKQMFRWDEENPAQVI